jgi:SEC-C motif-containing protein
MDYSECCQAVLSGHKKAVTAEALMRSRYSAYVAGDISYLLKTWHPSTRPPAIDAETIPRWCDLEIIRTEKGREEDLVGMVEFKASALVHQEILNFQEKSHFVKEAGQWLYTAGDTTEVPPLGVRKTNKVGRNCLCPCGSKKKFKKCCGC